MPIRINLKELFSADAQSTVVDKINFNFNKLLELGIGEQGERGFSGIQGAAGPIGLTGEQGTRGSIWFVDSASDPNTLTFNDLISADLYLDSTSFSIWQYDGTQWNFVANLANIINSYLTASPSPFKRGFGVDSPDDTRFIVFNKRDSFNESLLGVNGSTSTNDILLLSNFDEDLISPFIYAPAQNPTGNQIDTNTFYNSLLAISTNQISSLLGRNHIELGALYLDGDPKLSPVYENLKIKYNRVGGSLHSGLDHYNLSIFSLDIPDLTPSPTTKRVTNGIFNFSVPKVLNSPFENLRFDIYLGSKYGLDEAAVNGSGYIKSDGILFSSGSSFANVGFIEGHLIPNYPTSNTGYVDNQLTNAYLWLESLDANGIMLDDVIFQNGGNIIQLGTTEPRQKAITQAALGATNNQDFFARGAISIIGNEILTVFGNGNVYGGISSDLTGKFGYFNRFSLDDPNLPVSEILNYSKFNGAVSGGTTPTASCNQNLTPSEQPIGPGASDVAEDGEYVYVVNTQRRDKNTTFPVSGITYSQTAFQILKKRDKNNVALKRISRLGFGAESGSLGANIEINGANRIKLYGKYAIVTTGTLLNWPTPINLSGGANYAGRVSAIDISDPYNPRIQASAEYKTLANSTVCYMDMDIHDEIAVTLTWEQTNGVSIADLQIRLDVFDLGALKDLAPTATPSTASIEWIGKGAINIVNSTGLNSAQLGASVRYGAVTTDGKKAYVGYGNEIRVFNLTKDSRNQDSPSGPCYFSYAQTLSTTFTRTDSESITDIKILGNSLYVLASSLTSGRLMKYEVRGGALTKIWDKALTSAVSRFEVSGKHIYVACQGTTSSDKNTAAVITLDFDGFYTSSAHIESLRTEELTITKDLKVGSSANIFGQLNIGGSAQIQGHLGVKTAIQTPFIINDEGSLFIETADTFDVGAAFSIDMFANQNITLNAGGLTSQLRLLSGYDVELTAANKIDINSVTLDVYTNGTVTINADNASSLFTLRSANDMAIIALDRLDIDAVTFDVDASSLVDISSLNNINISATNRIDVDASSIVDISSLNNINIAATNLVHIESPNRVEIWSSATNSKIELDNNDVNVTATDNIELLVSSGVTTHSQITMNPAGQKSLYQYGSNQIHIKSDGAPPALGASTNALLNTLPLRFDGIITYEGGQLSLSSSSYKRDPAILSGIYSKTEGFSSNSTKTYTWIKIGSVVQVTGLVTCNNNGPVSTAQIGDFYHELPVVIGGNPLYESNTNLYGSGTYFSFGTNEMHPIEVKLLANSGSISGVSDKFYFTFRGTNNRENSGNARAGEAFHPKNGAFRFNFTYILP